MDSWQSCLLTVWSRGTFVHVSFSSLSVRHRRCVTQSDRRDRPWYGRWSDDAIGEQRAVRWNMTTQSARAGNRSRLLMFSSLLPAPSLLSKHRPSIKINLNFVVTSNATKVSQTWGKCKEGKAWSSYLAKLWLRVVAFQHMETQLHSCSSIEKKLMCWEIWGFFQIFQATVAPQMSS